MSATEAPPPAYVNGLLMAVLRPALDQPGRPSADHVGTKLPADLLEVLPFVHARITPGGRTNLGTRFQVPIALDVYAGGPAADRDAHNLAAAALQALERAHQRQLVTADGHIGALTNVSGPTDFPEPDRADGVARYLTTALLTARPPAA